MIEKIVTEIEEAIRQNNLHGAIDFLREWLENCEQGDPNKLLNACSPNIRRNMRVLLCDVLSYYPETILGFPLLIFGATKSADDCFLTLPFPTFENAHPCPGLRFLGWVPCDSSLPIRVPFRQKQYRTEVEYQKAVAYIGVFRAISGEHEIDVNAVQPMWWGDLFINHPKCEKDSENVRLEGNVLLSYPEALEVAAAMQAGAQGSGLPQTGTFHENLDWAYQQGSSFHEKCCNEFSDYFLKE